MEELTRVLWEYAACRLEGSYDREAQKERQECMEIADWNRSRLQAVCFPEALTWTENLCFCFETIRCIDMEAAFVSGLQLGLKLR